jgi:hypothetical protein
MSIFTEGYGHAWPVVVLAFLASLSSVPAAAADVKKLYGCAVITEPGSYLLATDIIVDQSCVSSDDPDFGFVGIQIAASDVHVNLGGHTVYGDPAGYGNGYARGIDTTGALQLNVRITNGTVDGSGAIGDGIYIQGAKHVSITNLRSTGNLRFGMGLVFCEDCNVTASHFYENGNAGIQTVFGGRDADGDEVVDGGVRLVGNEFRDNPNSNGLTIGFFPGVHEIIGNRFTGNFNGLSEFITPPDPVGHVIQANEFRGNLSGGIRVCSSGNTLRANKVIDNGGNGVEIAGGCFFFPTPAGTENLIQANFSAGNAGADMVDQDGGCSNTWKANTFENDSEGDGPKRGCIR